MFLYGRQAITFEYHLRATLIVPYEFLYNNPVVTLQMSSAYSAPCDTVAKLFEANLKHTQQCWVVIPALGDIAVAC